MSTIPELVLQTGHDDVITAVAYAPDGRRLWSVGADGKLIGWDTASRKAWRVIDIGVTLSAVAASPDGALVVVGGGGPLDPDFALRVVDARTGAVLGTIDDHELWIRALAWLPDGSALLTYDADGMLRSCPRASVDALDPAGCATLTRVKGFGGELAVRADGGAVAWEDEGKVFVGGPSGGEPWFHYKAKGGDVRGLAWADDTLLVAPADTTVVSLDSEGERGHTLSGLVGGTAGVWWLDGFAAVADDAGNLVYWDALAAKLEPVVALSEDGPIGVAALAPDDGSATIGWRSETYGQQHLARLDLIGGGTREYGSVLRRTEDAIPLGDGRRIAVWLDDIESPDFATGSPVAIVDLGTGQVERTLRMDAADLDDVAASADGQWLATLADGAVDVWDAQRGVLTRALTLADGAKGNVVALSPDGARLAVGDGDGRVTVWTVADGEVAWTAQAHTNTVGALAFSADGRLASGGWKIDHFLFTRLDPKDPDWKVRIWDAATGAPGPVMADHHESIVDLDWSPSGRLASTARDGTVRVWDPATDARITVDGPFWELSSAAWSRDGAMLAIASPTSHTVVLWDAASGQSRTIVSDDAPVRSVAFDSRHLVLAGGARVELWDLAATAPVGTLVLPDDDDLLAITGDEYLATRGALDAVGWRVGDDVVSFEQFDLWKNRPQDVLVRLGFADLGLVESFGHLVDRRIARSGLDPAKASFVPPKLELDGDVPLNAEGPTTTIRIRASDATVGLDRLIVAVRGVPIDGPHGRPLAAAPGEQATAEVVVPLGVGTNPIELSVVNAAGVESLRREVEVEYSPTDDAAWERTLWVYAVGVGDYERDALDLRYAAKDARDVAAGFAAQSDPWDHVVTQVITDHDATRDAILGLHAGLARSGPNDLVVVFLAGHGLLDADEQYWFGTTDVDPADPGARGVAYADLEALFDGIPATRRLLMMDTCHAGEVDPDEAAPVLAAGVVARGVDVQARGANAVLGKRPLAVGTEVMKSWFADLRRESGATVIAAAGGQEYALESGQWQNGVFTSSLLRGLGGDADLDHDGYVTSPELLRFTSARVSELTGGAQVPVARRENSLGFTIAKLAPSTR
jgi:WD40 repeat protein